MNQFHEPALIIHLSRYSPIIESLLCNQASLLKAKRTVIKREPLMPENYFDDRIRYIERTMSDRLRKLQSQHTKPEIFLHANFRDSHRLVFLDYCCGESIANLARRFPAVVSAWEQYPASPKLEINDFSAIDDYVISLWPLCLAILFNVENALLDRLFKCIDNEGKDMLFERLVAVRVSGRRVATTLVKPKPYELLYKMIDASSETRNEFMMAFSKSWYNSLSDTYWHECHKGPQGGGFFGYWSMEAAGVVKAFAIDDEAFRDLGYYPKDLVSGLLRSAGHP